MKEYVNQSQKFRKMLINIAVETARLNRQDEDLEPFYSVCESPVKANKLQSGAFYSFYKYYSPQMAGRPDNFDILHWTNQGDRPKLGPSDVFCVQAANYNEKGHYCQTLGDNPIIFMLPVNSKKRIAEVERK